MENVVPVTMQTVERKLVTVRKIADLRPIEGADSIEVAQVDGWQCVVKKGDFKVGDLGIYFEIDSVLPDRKEFEFMRHRRFRVRTIKLRGQLSQGLMMPLAIANEFVSAPEALNVGDDLTQILGVQKYEIPLPPDMKARVKGNFPAFTQKTDQERVQNIPDEIAKLQGQIFEVTEKLDGSSMTVYKNGADFGVCSRNLDLKLGDTPEENCSQWKVALKMGLIDALERAVGNYAIQGELIGPGIQKNYYGLKEQQFRIFDVYDIDKCRYLTPLERAEKLQEMGIWNTDNLVPVINGLCELPSLETILDMADGKSDLADVVREGIVFKSVDLIDGHVFHFKAISNKFLLKEE